MGANVSLLRILDSRSIVFWMPLWYCWPSMIAPCSLFRRPHFWMPILGFGHRQGEYLFWTLFWGPSSLFPQRKGAHSRCKSYLRLQKGLMTEVAKTGTLGEMLSVLVVCEWTYFILGTSCWSRSCSRRVCAIWMDWFAHVLGRCGCLFASPSGQGRRNFLDESGKEACRARFLQAVQLEEDFFDDAYQFDKFDH